MTSRLRIWPRWFRSRTDIARAATSRARIGAKCRWFAWRDGRTVPILLAIALVIANAVLAAVVVHGLRTIYVQVQDTQDALTALYRLDADIRKISRLHREFLLTGLPQFLAEYRAARHRVPGEAAQIRALTADSPDQQDRMDLVARRLEEDASTVDAAIALGHPGLGAGVLQEVLGPERLYSSVQQVIADMYLEEGRLQTARIGAVVERTEQALVVSGTAHDRRRRGGRPAVPPDMAQQGGARRRGG